MTPSNNSHKVNNTILACPVYGCYEKDPVRYLDVSVLSDHLFHQHEAKPGYITSKVNEEVIKELESLEALTHNGRGTILWEMDALCDHIEDRIRTLKDFK